MVLTCGSLLPPLPVLGPSIRPTRHHELPCPSSNGPRAGTNSSTSWQLLRCLPLRTSPDRRSGCQKDRLPICHGRWPLYTSHRRLLHVPGCLKVLPGGHGGLTLCDRLRCEHTGTLSKPLRGQLRPTHFSCLQDPGGSILRRHRNGTGSSHSQRLCLRCFFLGQAANTGHLAPRQMSPPTLHYQLL